MRDDPFGDLIPSGNPQMQSQSSGMASDDPFQDLVPQQQDAAPTQQPNLSTGAQIASDLIFGVPALYQGVGEGLKNAGRGIKQAFLQGTEALGLQPEGTTADYTKETDAARQQFANSPLAQYMPNTSSVGQFIGNTAPYLAIPMGAGEGLAARIGSGALTGAAIGGTQYVPEGDSRALSTALGAATGGVLPVAGAGLAKGINAIKGGTEAPAAQELIQAAAKHDVPLFAADVSDNSLLKGATQGLEDVPIIGAKQPRLEQMQKAQAAAQNVVNDAKQQMLNTNFGDNNGIAAVQDIAKSNDPVRSTAAQSILQDIQGAGDDWQKIIENSGNLKLFNNKLMANKLYNNVAEKANQFGAIDTSKITDSVQSLLNKENGAVLKNEPLINTLQKIQSNLFTATPTGAIPRALNYSDIKNFRSDLGSEISDYFTGKNAAIGQKGVGALQELKDQTNNTLNNFAQQNGPELKQAWQNADQYYKNNVIPYKDPQLAKALTNASPDEIYSKFITTGETEGGKGTSRAQRFYNALDDKGQAAVRYGMLSNAMEKATNRDAGTFSPAIFASSLDKIAAAKGVFFKGQQKAEIDGFKNLMRHVERSRIATAKPETGIKAIPVIAAGLGFGAHAAGATGADLGLSAAGIYGLRKLLTTDGGRRLLLASSKLKSDSPVLQKVIDKTAKFIRTGAPIGASSFANAPQSPQQNQVQMPQIPAQPQQMQQPQQVAPIQATPAPAPALPQKTSQVNPELINRIAQIESNNNPNAKAKGSSASGVLQFTNSTWKDAINKYGEQTGYTLKDKNNPAAQKAIAQLMLNDNAEGLTNFLGRAPKPAEIYLTHFLGNGGARALLASNPNQFAAQVLPEAAKANRSVFFKNGVPVTVAQLYQNFNNKIGKAVS